MGKGTATIGITGADLLLVAFIVLKLCGVINWSWVWVLAPLWIPLVVFLIIIGIILITQKVSGNNRRRTKY